MTNFISIILSVFFICCSSISAQEAAEQTSPSDATAFVITDEGYIVWINGMLPGLAQTEGQWQWDTDKRDDDVASHTDTAADTGLLRHSFTTDASIKITKDSKIIQYVSLEPKNKTKGIMLRLKFKDIKDDISCYWEGPEEAFVDMKEYITAWYIGVLPKENKWVELMIDCKELDIPDQSELEGMGFITRGGRVWWGKTIIKEG